MDGGVKFGAIHWKISPVALATVLTLTAGASRISAQSGPAPHYIIKSTIIPVGNYTSNYASVQVCGGTLFERSMYIGKPIKVELSEGSRFENVSLNVSNCELRAKGVYFKGCRISFNSIGPGARVIFEDCKFDKVTFRLGSQFFGSPESFDQYRTHLWLKNSVLNQVSFQSSPSMQSVIGLKMEQCTVLGPGRMPSMPPAKADFLRDMKKAETGFNSCVFSKFTYTLPTLALTKGCVFDACILDPTERVEALSTRITATFRPDESADTIRSNHPQIILTPAPLSPEPGCRLAYTLVDGEISTEGLPSAALPLTDLAIAVPPAIPVPGGPIGPAMPPPAAPPPLVQPQPQRPAPPTLVNATAIGTNGAPDTGLKLHKASLGGLQLRPRPDGEEGFMAKMEAVALPGAIDGSSAVRCDVPVTAMMGKALQEVAKFTQINSGGWPQGHEITLFFTGKYSENDGAAPAVATALLLHSLISGKELDQTIAVAGDLNADGSVQPVSGIAERIRGAARSQCKLAGVPAKSDAALGDLLLSDGPAPFATVQIFGLEHFREAEALALTTKPEPLVAAISEMNRVQEVLLRNPAQMGTMLRNQHVIAKLQQVLKDAPNHLSARYLLLYASGRMPQTISLAGSFDAIDEAGKVLLDAMKWDKGDDVSYFGKDSLGSSLTRLQALRARCDARARPYADALLRFGTTVKEAMDRPAQSYARTQEYKAKIGSAADAVEAELARLLNDPSIREAMNE